MLLFNLKDSVCEIQMGLHLVLIDRQDLLVFARHSWHITRKGRSYYLQTNRNSTTVEFHRLILGKRKDLEIDHINLNGLDNRRSNLRFVSHVINRNNNRKRKAIGTSSRFRGVHWSRVRSGWYAQVSFRDHTKNLGRFPSEDAAALAYNNYILKHKLPKPLNEL